MTDKPRWTDAQEEARLDSIKRGAAWDLASRVCAVVDGAVGVAREDEKRYAPEGAAAREWASSRGLTVETVIAATSDGTLFERLAPMIGGTPGTGDDARLLLQDFQRLADERSQGGVERSGLILLLRWCNAVLNRPELRWKRP